MYNDPTFGPSGVVMGYDDWTNMVLLGIVAVGAALALVGVIVNVCQTK